MTRQTSLILCVALMAFSAPVSGQDRQPRADLAVGAADARGAEDTMAGQVAERAAHSVVAVWCGDARSGTGFAFGEGRIATARHVADCPRTVSVETLDGRRSEARIALMSSEHDIAILLPAEELELEPIVFRTDPPERSLRAYAAGFPSHANEEGLGLTVTSGVVTHMTGDVIDSDAAVGPGNSGSPLVDSRMRLIGVVFGTNGFGISRAVPAERLRALSDDEDSGGDVRDRFRLNLGSHFGVLVDNEGVMVGGQIEFGASLNDEWSLRFGAGYFTSTEEHLIPEPSALNRNALNLSLGVGYRVRFELADGLALAIEPYVGLAVTRLESERTSYALGFADPACDPASQMCAIETSSSASSLESWRVQPLLGVRFILSDLIHIGYQLQLDVENPENSEHLVTIGVGL